MEASQTGRCCTLHALDLADDKRRCCMLSSKEILASDKVLLYLEILAWKCKIVIDSCGLEYDTLPVFRFIRKLSENQHFRRDFINESSLLKYLYFKKKLKMVLQHNFIVDYICIIRPRLESCPSVAEAETLIRKFLRVHRLISSNAHEIEEYEFTANLIQFAFINNIQKSHLVIDLLKAVIDLYSCNVRDIRCGHQLYSQEFFEFILRHCVRAHFDLEFYSRSNPRSLWLYSRNFSVARAVAFGNVPRTMALLQYGFPVFSDTELRRNGHGYPYLAEIMPQSHLMVLCMMCSMMSVNRCIPNPGRSGNHELYSVKNDQMECFRLIWRAIPEPYVRQLDLSASLSSEHSMLTRALVFDTARNNRNSRLSEMYETCFPDMANGPKEPRTLKHLCRWAIRKRLQENWLLPAGISQLRLPVLLKAYLNLEIE